MSRNDQTNRRADADRIAADIMRKVGALAVAAMQNNGAPPRA